MDLGSAYASAGNGEAAGAILTELDARSMHEYVPPLCFAAILASSGRKEDALAHIERSYLERDPTNVCLKRWPFHWTALHGEPRFEALLARIGLN